jgi:hypothetical protein
MALSGPRAWTDREPFKFEDAVTYDEQFEMKEVNSFWPNFFVGINGGNWMVLDGILASESQVDAPIVRYGRTGAATPTLTAWCTGGEGAPIHPKPYRPEVLVIFASAGVLSFEGAVRVFNTTAEDTYDYSDAISVTAKHRLAANIRSEGDVYATSPEGSVRAAGELIGQLTMATVLDHDVPVFAGLVKTGSGAMVATALGKVYTWADTLTSWTIAPYYDGGIVHVRTSEFLDVTIPGSTSGGGSSDLNPVVNAVDGVAQAIAGGGASGTPHIVLAVDVDVDKDSSVSGTIRCTRGSLGEADPGEGTDVDAWSEAYDGSMLHSVPDAPVCVSWSVSGRSIEASWGVAVVELGSHVDLTPVDTHVLRLSVDKELTQSETTLKVRIEAVEP